MWTIRSAERLRFPRVPSVEQLAARERGEMLAFAHIPAGPAATAMRFKAGEEEDPDRGARYRRATGSMPRQHAGEDLEAQILLVAQAIGAPLEDTDLVVEAFDEAE